MAMPQRQIQKDKKRQIHDKNNNQLQIHRRGDLKPVSGILKRPPVEPELALPVGTI